MIAPARVGAEPVGEADERATEAARPADVAGPRSGRLARRAVRGPLADPAAALDPRGGGLHRRLGRPARRSGLHQQINLILLVAGLAAGPIVGVVLRQRVDAPEAAGRRGGSPPTSSRASRCRLDYTLENARRWTAALALFVEDDLVPGRPLGLGRGGLLAAGLLRPGAGPASGRGSAGRGSSPKRGPVPVPDARAGHPVAVRPAASGGSRSPTPDELIVYPTVGQLTRRWHLVQRQATETRRGPAARPLVAAAGISRPARLPARRQPALDPLADLGAARQADGQGVRAAERAGPRHPDRPVAAPDQGHAPSSARRWSRRSGSPRRSAWRPAGTRAGASCWAGPGRRPGVRQGPASVKLLHELLEQLAVMRPSTEGTLSAPARRPAAVDPPRGDPDRRLDPAGQPDRGGRAVVAALGRRRRAGLLGRVILLDASRGDLADLIQYGGDLDADRAATAATAVDSEPRPIRGRPPDGPTARRAGVAAAAGRNGQGGRP